MSDHTPRTDANEWTPNGLPSVVEAEFARTLEREAAALRANRDALAAALRSVLDMRGHSDVTQWVDDDAVIEAFRNARQALSQHGGNNG